MRALLVLLAIALLVVIALLSLGFINIDQTQTAALPSIKVEGGQAPEFKADVGKVELGTRNETVELPTLSVEKAGNTQ